MGFGKQAAPGLPQSASCEINFIARKVLIETLLLYDSSENELHPAVEMHFMACQSLLGQDPSPVPAAAWHRGLRLGFGVCARVEGMAFSVSGLGFREQATQSPVLLQTGVGFGV